MPTPIFRRVRDGAGFGLLLAVIYCVIALAVYWVRGFGNVEAAYGIKLHEVAAAYIISGVVAGGLFGLALPKIGRSLTAYAVGVVATLPLFASLAAFQIDRNDWWPVGAMAVVITAVVIGGGIGLIIKEEFHK